MDWNNYIRDVYKNYILTSNDMIGRPTIIVQIDESLMNKCSYGVGRILENRNLWIVGGIDKLG